MTYPFRSRWLYAKGQMVAWAGHPGRWRVAWRRVTERDVLGPLHEYGLCPVEGEDPGVVQWADEADIAAEEEQRA